jgi:hypothetical protein
MQFIRQSGCKSDYFKNRRKPLMTKSERSTAVFLRRLSQTVFLMIFIWLFYALAYHPENTAVGPTGMFFNLDPLITLTGWLGGHAVASALLLSLITLAVTVVFGRCTIVNVLNKMT